MVVGPRGRMRPDEGAAQEDPGPAWSSRRDAGLRGAWDGTHGPTGCHCAWSFLLLSRAPAMHTAPALCSSPRLFSPLKHESFGFTFVRLSSLVPLLLGLRYMEMPFVRFREGTWNHNPWSAVFLALSSFLSQTIDWALFPKCLTS